MNASHAASGALVWLAGCGAVTVAGAAPTPAAMAIGTVVAAGFATAPDIDCPDAHPARAFGPAGRFLARRVAALSLRVYAATRTPTDWARTDGHRLLTHTHPAAVAAGWVAAVAAWILPGPTAVLLLAVAALWATRAVVPYGWRASGPVLAVVYLAGSVLTWRLVPVGAWWLGLAVAVGWAAHLVGDVPADGGAPLGWPWAIRGRRWYRVALPPRLRMVTGGRAESLLVRPALFAATGLVALALVWA